MMTMSPKHQTKNLIEHLPKIRGRYSENVPLSRTTWFQVGGDADIIFKPADLEDLQYFLKNKPDNIPVMVLGVGSNLLVRDGGVDGVVIRLGRAFANIEVDGNFITAGASALDLNVAKKAASANITGLEFYAGIPGTIGGALRMNAGAYGPETKDILKCAYALSPDGKLHELSATDMGFSYRHCDIPDDWIFIKAVFEGSGGNADEIRARMEKIQASRTDSQPVKSRTGGSTFKNPTDQKAWRLIDEAGCRGLMMGQAQVSNQHCNFLINTGEASALDIEKLGEEIRRRVKAESGVNLQWEIKRIGRPKEGIDI